MPRETKTAKKLSAEEASYLAGIVDGEGCFSAGLNRGYVTADLEIGSVHEEFLRNLRETVDVGSLCKKRKRTKNARPLYVWSISTGSLESIIIQILPYLRLKRRQAEIVLWLVRCSAAPSVVIGDGTLQLESIKNLRILNHRGTTLAA
jgi:hypothetical protein